ncbi:MAG: response regulator [Pseudomonadales bacterium]|nr:response regulator [Pseudomonadales bacterium]
MASTQRQITVEQTNSSNRLQLITHQFHIKIHEVILDYSNDWSQLVASQFDSDLASNFLRKTHNIGGSTASYIMTDISETIFNLEGILRQHLASNGVDYAEQIDRTINSLVRQAEHISNNHHHQDHLFDYSILKAACPEILKVSHSDITIYVTDDDPMQSELITLQLQTLGYNSKSFTTLIDLREAVVAAPPNIIICDIVFPESEYGGIEAVRSLKRTNGINIPVLFISSKKSTEIRLLALRSGGDGFFLNRLTCQILSQKLISLL